MTTTLPSPIPFPPCHGKQLCQKPSTETERRVTIYLRLIEMLSQEILLKWPRFLKRWIALTPRQNVCACARLSISGLFFSHTFQSDQSLPRALSFILCAACGSVVLLYAARVFDYFVLIEIAFMDNQAQITETISRLDSEKVR